MRPRKTNRHLPPCVYVRRGAYYYVQKGRWHPLGRDLHAALIEYARLASRRPDGMEALIDRAAPEILRGKSAATVKQYTAALSRLRHVLAEFSPDQVRPSDVAQIRDAHREHPNATNRLLSVLRQVFDFALEWQLVERNPCVGIRRLKESKRTRYLSDAEYDAIYEAASPSLRPIIAVAYLTGQRIGDVLAIRMNDVTDDGIVFQQQKTGARLMIEMSDELRAAVQAAKMLRRPVRGMTLFCTVRGGRPYSYETVRDMWETACKKAGVADANLHDLRAKSLTEAKRQGLDPQALGGHTTEAMTRRYIRDRDTVVVKGPSRA
jgi:integrase